MSHINDLSNLLLTQVAEQSATPTPNVTGQTDFLKLLVAQMSYQAPSSVQDLTEGIIPAKKAADDHALGEFSHQLPLNQALQASAMVGRKVHIENCIGILDSVDCLQGSVNLSQPVTHLTISFSHPEGNVIHTLSLGAKPSGIIDFKWDGKDSKGHLLSPGAYYMSAESVVNGKKMTLRTNAVCHVDSVTLDQGSQKIVLNLREVGTVTLSEIKKLV